MTKIEKISKHGSERNMALKYMKAHKFWHTPRSICRILNLNMTDASMGRRMREDSKAGNLRKRNIHGYTEFKWGSR